MKYKNEDILEKLGGKTFISEYLGVSKTAVYMWFYEKPKGTDGKIPAKHARKLYALAQEKNVDCTLLDILGE